MKRILLLFSLLYVTGTGYSQFNYIAANAQVAAGTYTDLGVTGTAFTATNLSYDDGNSAAQNIGFSFVYNGVTYTQFILNTNGFIKLGSTAPAINYIPNVLSSGETNVIAPFNMDLFAGTGTPEYRVATTGTSPNRVCTIQFENLRDYVSPRQYDNINFQIKLYEQTRNIEFVYGSFAASANATATLISVVGIKGSSAFRSVNAYKGAAASWAFPTFINGEYTSVKFHNDKTVLPAFGTTYRFVQAPLTDAEVTHVYTLGKLPASYVVPHTISTRITNTGATTLTNLPVSLAVTGANTYSNLKTVTLAPQATAVVNFDAFSPAVNGVNTATVTIPADNINGNNSNSYQQVVNENTFSYADSSAPTAILGFGTLSGMMLVKYTITGTATVSSAYIRISESANAGNTLYAVVMNLAGTVVAQSSNFITNLEDIGQYRMFYFNTPPSFTNTGFYVGLVQTANPTTAYFPLSVQSEASPSRPGAFYTKNGTGNGIPTESTVSGRLMIQAVLNNATIPSNTYSNTYWTWMKGDNTLDNPGVYGTMGVAASPNKPGARSGAVSWTDTTGNLWLFGGSGIAVATPGLLNDLWKFDPLTNQWNWVSGDNTVDNTGIYGSIGSVSPGNKPGGRSGAITWVDGSNNLWLFGGYGKGKSQTGKLNDLWQYNISSNQWTWISGDSTVDNYGNYGNLGNGDGSTKPGSRNTSHAFYEDAGYLWLMGGSGYAKSNSGNLNDLWKYDINNNQWTWVHGDSTVNRNGVYGTTGIPDAGNKPGGRNKGVSWSDPSGNFWLFGGDGLANTGGSSGSLNDLWKYSMATNQWTFVKGDSIQFQVGVFGTKGFASPENKPGGREGAVSWCDGSGNLWLFGGDFPVQEAQFNDLWKYNPVSNQWTWIKGSKNGIPGAGVYGVMGVEAAGNTPGVRYDAVSWSDKVGNLWLFGGYDDGGPGQFNDLWSIYGGTRYVFTGNGSWDIATNWLSNLIGPKNIPGGVSVIIDNIVTGQCDVTGTINIQQAGKLTIQPTKKLNINSGDLTNSGLLNGTGTVTFSGTATTLSSSGIISAPIILSSKEISLVGGANTNSILLSGGSHIQLNGFDLRMDTATLVGDASNFIITNGTGNLLRSVGAFTKLFPIGISSSSYTPVTITNNGAFDIFKVRVGTGVTTAGRTLDPILSGNVNRTWYIQETVNGGSNAMVKLQWNLAEEQGAFNRASSYISHFQVCPLPNNCDIGFYDSYARSAATGTDPYTQTRDNISSFNSPSFIVTSQEDVYRFINATGNGNWNDQMNWTNERVPPNTIPFGMTVLIDPETGQCNFTGILTVQPGGKITVTPGKVLNVYRQ